MGLVDLLLLGDGRAPVGVYAHSFGLESAVAAGDVDTATDHAAFVEQRLRVAGSVDAAFAAAAHLRWGGASPGSGPAALAPVEAELAARISSPAVRTASRELGRHLLRLAVRAWPCAPLQALRAARPHGWLQPVAVGAVGVAAGLEARETAVLSAYGLASAIASAGVRLLGLDPIDVHALLARLGPQIESLADAAVTAARGSLDALPAHAVPLIDIRAEHHAAPSTGRLFAS